MKVVKAMKPSRPFSQLEEEATEVQSDVLPAASSGCIPVAGSSSAACRLLGAVAFGLLCFFLGLGVCLQSPRQPANQEHLSGDATGTTAINKPLALPHLYGSAGDSSAPDASMDATTSGNPVHPPPSPRAFSGGRMPLSNASIAEGRSLAAYPLAQCLDGTPAMYYLSEGNASRVFVFFEGGGFCQNLAECQVRAASYLGSTSHDKRSLVLDRPYFTRSPAASPLLHSFTFAYVRYCDGGYFSGNRISPVMHNGTRLHFRGRHILKAVLDDLNLDRATDVVIGGCSAGGIHVLAHLDMIRAMLPSTVAVLGFADSGFYTDVDSFTRRKRFVVSPDGQNASGSLSPACTAAFPDANEKCLIAQRNAPFLRTPTFVWQSKYDLDQRSCEMSPDCASSPTCVDAYSRRLSRAIHDELLNRGRPHTMRASTAPLVVPPMLLVPPRHGAFIDTCERHCDDGVKRPHTVFVDGVTPLQAFALWHSSALVPHARTAWEMDGGQTMC